MGRGNRKWPPSPGAAPRYDAPTGIVEPHAGARPLRYEFVSMTETAARAIAAWTYPTPYALYNHGLDRRDAVVQALLDPAHRFRAVTQGSGTLVAFCCLGPNAQVVGGDYARPAIDIGMGMRPDLTGLGHGGGLVAAVLDHARGARPGTTMRVTVAAFNARARRVWEAAGFRERSRFVRASDNLEFVVLTLAPS